MLLMVPVDRSTKKLGFGSGVFFVLICVFGEKLGYTPKFVFRGLAQTNAIFTEMASANPMQSPQPLSSALLARSEPHLLLPLIRVSSGSGGLFLFCRGSWG
ncbi:dynamin-2A isoform X1 [Iris pallida]|uniref:Dynamin-2A isoform X1 n=1 Tax=Iris pallida TaxID=29817 RepID=A0AAX6FHK1_IRIPA|nr:dynamin-2A isoform X1 [Iris pallida]